MSQHKEQQLRQVLELLSDGDFHSGQAIAEHLDVSRAYIWKLVQQLQEMGLAIESVTRKGYRLQQTLQLIDAEVLNEKLSNLHCELLLTTDSTNQQLKHENFVANKVVIAEYQSAGRGRRGRQWLSPLASNLYWSYGWQTSLPVQQLGGLSLVVGLAIVDGLEQLGFTDIDLKWPNDIRYQGKKLGGILVELSGDAAGGLQVIIGVGLNVHMTVDTGKNIDQAWISLEQIGKSQAVNPKTVNRTQVLVHCLQSLQTHLQKFSTQGFAGFADKWKQYDESFGQLVEIHQADEILNGIGAGVDHSGAFLLKKNDQLLPIYAGEVSLRLKEKLSK